MDRFAALLQTLDTVSSLVAVDPVRDILTLGPVWGDQHWPGVSWATCHVSRVPVFRMLGCTGPRSSACVSPPSDCLHAVLQCSMLLYAALQCSILSYAALQAGPQWCSSRVILMPDTVGLGRVYHSLFTPYTTDFILVTKLRYHDIFESIYSWVFKTAAWQWNSTFTIRSRVWHVTWETHSELKNEEYRGWFQSVHRPDMMQIIQGTMQNTLK